MSQTYHLRLKRSPGLLAVTVFLHGFGVLASFWSLEPVAAMGFSVLFIGNLLWLWRRNLRPAVQTVNMVIFRETEWLLQQDGREVPVQVCGSTVVWPWLVRLVFRYEENNRKGSLLIPRDAMSDTDYRHLSRCLRVVAVPDAAPSA